MVPKRLPRVISVFFVLASFAILSACSEGEDVNLLNPTDSIIADDSLNNGLPGGNDTLPGDDSLNNGLPGGNDTLPGGSGEDSLINYTPLEPSGADVLFGNMPSEMHFSVDGRMLLTGRPVQSGLYDSSEIRTIRLSFSQADFWEQLLYNKDNETGEEVIANMVVGTTPLDRVGVSFRGNNSYLRPREDGSQKLPFQISIDYMEDQDFMGYQTLNLNNAYLDPSFMREVFYRRQIRKHIPAARTSFVRLYINNEDWGLYINVQQLNKDFLREWFFNEDGARWRAESPDGPRLPIGGGAGGWSDGYSALTYLGGNLSSYQQYYTLRTDVTIVDNPWQRLMEATRAIDDTPIEELPSVVINYLDVDRTLWFLACEIVFVDEDGYVHKGQDDYFIYYDPTTGWITPLEFDANELLNSRSVTRWGPFYNSSNPNYPLLYKLLAVNEYRQRFLAHMRTIIRESLDPSQTDIIFDNLRSQIESHVQSDPKKLSTHSDFVREVEALKNSVRQRRSHLLSNNEVAQVAPVIESVDYYNSSGQLWTAPTPRESVTIVANVTSQGGISGVNLHYSTSLAGAFRRLEMQEISTGRYEIEIPPLPGGSFFRFYVEAVSNNSARSVSFSPAGAEHDVYVFRVR